jgi:hypothetical protein
VDTAQYERSGGGALLLLGKQRRTLPNRFQDTGYFINDHHANQFRKMFPLVWSALEHGVAATGRPAFESALAALRIIAPTTYLSLEKVGDSLLSDKRFSPEHFHDVWRYPEFVI